MKLFLTLLNLFSAASLPTPPNNVDNTTTLTLVETMPTQMEDLNQTVALHTHSAVIQLFDNAKSTIDLAVMYWSLLPKDCGWKPNHTKTTTADCSGFTRKQLDQQFLATRGRAVYTALTNALARGVQVRALQSAGFASEDDRSNHSNPESAELAIRFPATFAVRTLNMSQWYGDGIQHTKFMIVDGHAIMLGSSNFMDFRSLSLVKELGILVHNAPTLATDLGMFFTDAWSVAGVETPSEWTSLLYDEGALRSRMVPSWSPLLQIDPNTINTTTKSPLPSSTPATKVTPLKIQFNQDHSASSVFVSCSPLALCGGNARARRTSDEVALVSTIKQSTTDIAIAVMDFVPGSMGIWAAGAPVYWPALVDAIVAVVNAKAVRARIMVSQWQWTDPTMMPYLKALSSMASVCKHALAQTCQGSLEIRTFVVPGWNETVGVGRTFPGHSRVNHNKYIVSDSTANIATSNMAWSYFRTTVGTSINIESKSVAKELMAIFDRDWHSQYVVPLDSS